MPKKRTALYDWTSAKLVDGDLHIDKYQFVHNPQGQDVSEGKTGHLTMDVDPRGFVVMGGEDDASGSADNHFYWQSNQHSCFFGAGSQISPSQYNDGHFLNPTVSTLSHPKVEFSLFQNGWGPRQYSFPVFEKRRYPVEKSTFAAR